MPENYSNLPSYIMVGLIILFWILFFLRFLVDRFAPEKTVHAKVVNKGKEKVFSKTGAYGRSERYYVVFQTDEKKLSFYVSAFSYNGYRKGETGKLTSKGRRLISFQ